MGTDNPTKNLRRFGLLHWCYEKRDLVADCPHYDYTRTKARGCQYRPAKAAQS